MAPRSSRRMFLGGAIAGIAAPALALQITDAPEDVDAAWRARCETANVHEQLVSELRRQVQDPDLRARAETILAAMRCPTCGCSLRSEQPGRF